MRYLIITLCLFALVGHSQNVAPKKTNVILVSTTLPDSVLYKQAGRLLLKNSYSISKSDRDFMQIQTDTRKVKGANAYPRLTISISKGQAKVMGYFGSSIGFDSSSDKDPTRITNRGMKGSPFKAAFDLMNEYAIKLAEAESGTLSYEVAP